MSIEITDPLIQSYAEDHTTIESPLLQKINRDTYSNILMPRMLSGHLQGRFLSMISRMIRPTLILEIGTYTGYSALCLAEGLIPEGRLITIDANEELESTVKSYFRASPYATQLEYKIGKAVEILPSLVGQFDLVFIDADKENNCLYFDLLIDRVTLGGFILVDNVLWSGKVLDGKMDKDTRAIDLFNKKIQADDRVENVLLPLRDGIMLIQKIKK